MEGDRQMRLRLVALAILVAPAISCRIAAAQDAAIVSPDIYSVEIENQWVRVLRVKLAPHQASKPHTQPPGVAVLLTDVRAKVTFASGDVIPLNQQAGQVVEVKLIPQSR